MNVLHINKFEPVGAASAVRRIHLGMLRAGVSSKILYQVNFKTKTPIPNTYRIDDVATKKSLFERALRKAGAIINRKQILSKDFQLRKRGAEIFSFPYSSFDITSSLLYQEADLIMLHWVAGFLDEESFFKKNRKPVVWRMADLYPCGAGWHYEIGFPFDKLKPEIESNFSIRKRALSHTENLTFVPISHWVEQKANDSNLISRFPKKIIHNGIDLGVFKPHNQHFARNVFGLDSSKKILLFGSQSISNPRKGFDLLISAVKKLDLSDIQIVTFGEASNFDVTDLPFSVKHVKEISEERLLSILYASADLYVMPSIEEAFGQTTIEALGSGTPVVSFPNGGSSDIIINGLNGFLANEFTPDALAIAIKKALGFNFNKSEIIKDIESRFDIENKVGEYLTLCKELVNTP